MKIFNERTKLVVLMPKEGLGQNSSQPYFEDIDVSHRIEDLQALELWKIK
jgi:hypothetical protein